jgi:hypothetical protein
MSGFTLSYTANMFILMIPYDFCLFPAKFKTDPRYIGSARITEKTRHVIATQQFTGALTAA